MLLRSGTVPEDLNTMQLEGIGLVASTAASLSTEKFGGIPSVPEKKLVEKNLLNMCHNTEMICRMGTEE
jgi:fructokinase/fructan beta-fructosidase